MDPADKPIVTKQDIVEGLGQIGLAGGDLVQVHSSLSALGHVIGGAEAVVDALLEVVGPGGTVMMPTFLHGSCDVFDAWHSPSRNGAISEALRLRPESRRSRHPTHPYGAIGREADWLTEGVALELTFGPESPLGRLSTAGGKVLLLGVGMRANTAAHVGETLAGAHCLGYMESRLQVITDSGEVRTARGIGQWRQGPCLIEWDAITGLMLQAGMIRKGYIGSGEVYLMPAVGVVDTVARLAARICPICSTQKGEPRHKEGAAIGDWNGGSRQAVTKK